MSRPSARSAAPQLDRRAVCIGPLFMYGRGFGLIEVKGGGVVRSIVIANDVPARLFRVRALLAGRSTGLPLDRAASSEAEPRVPSTGLSVGGPLRPIHRSAVASSIGARSTTHDPLGYQCRNPFFPKPVTPAHSPVKVVVLRASQPQRCLAIERHSRRGKCFFRVDPASAAAVASVLRARGRALSIAYVADDDSIV